MRDADGILAPMVINGSYVTPDCVFNSSCPYGLMNYFQVIANKMFFLKTYYF